MATDGSPRRRIAPLLLSMAVLGAVALHPTPAAAAERAGASCGAARTGVVRTDGTTGAAIACSAGADGLRWRVVPRGTRTAELAAAPQSQLITGAAPGPTPTTIAGAGSTVDPLPATLGDPTGLPPGVVLPPGTAVRAGSPLKLPAVDHWKRHRWMTSADVPTTDLAAVHAHFVAQCAALGWRHDVARDQRLPSAPTAGRAYDRDAQMVIGSCRTRAGSATDPTRRRPWYLAWSATLRPGAGATELVVELRDTSPHGGRFG